MCMPRIRGMARQLLQNSRTSENFSTREEATAGMWEIKKKGGGVSSDAGVGAVETREKGREGFGRVHTPAGEVATKAVCSLFP